MSTRVAVVVVSSALVLFGPGVSRAVAVGVSDNFEDGNYTANPAWNIWLNQGTDGGVVPDPIRSGNLAWKARGSESGFELIKTTDFAPMPWEGFRSSVEFLTTTSTRFHGAIELFDDGVTQKLEGYGVHLSHDVTSGDQAKLSWEEFNPSAPTVVTKSTWFPLSLVPINEWLRLSMWHDPVSGKVNADVRRVSDNQLVVEDSLTPVVFGGPRPLSELRIAVGELEWQYMDNATLTPEPATFAMLILGGLGAMRRRR